MKFVKTKDLALDSACEKALGAFAKACVHKDAIEATLRFRLAEYSVVPSGADRLGIEWISRSTLSPAVMHKHCFVDLPKRDIGWGLPQAICRAISKRPPKECGRIKQFPKADVHVTFRPGCGELLVSLHSPTRKYWDMVRAAGTIDELEKRLKWMADPSPDNGYLRYFPNKPHRTLALFERLKESGIAQLTLHGSGPHECWLDLLRVDPDDAPTDAFGQAIAACGSENTARRDLESLMYLSFALALREGAKQDAIDWFWQKDQSNRIATTLDFANGVCSVEGAVHEDERPSHAPIATYAGNSLGIDGMTEHEFKAWWLCQQESIQSPGCGL